jgi:ketosteroid isomerase-like protein
MLTVCQENQPMKRTAVSLVFWIAMAGFTQTGLAQTAPAAKPAKLSHTAAGGVDKTLLQKVWDGWGTLDAAGQKQFYAQGPHVFFDVSPLKYGSWEEYQANVAKELAEYKAARFTVNDDAQIHKSGDAYWVTATVASDMTQKSGKREMATFRWTAVFEKQEGKWVIVHEHVSEAQPL